MLDQLSSEIGVLNGVFRHPVLGVVMCKQCRLYYQDGNWQQDEEGYDVFCRFIYYNTLIFKQIVISAGSLEMFAISCR